MLYKQCNAFGYSCNCFGTHFRNDDQFQNVRSDKKDPSNSSICDCVSLSVCTLTFRGIFLSFTTFALARREIRHKEDHLTRYYQTTFALGSSLGTSVLKQISSLESSTFIKMLDHSQSYNQSDQAVFIILKYQMFHFGIFRFWYYQMTCFVFQMVQAQGEYKMVLHIEICIRVKQSRINIETNSFNWGHLRSFYFESFLLTLEGM